MIDLKLQLVLLVGMAIYFFILVYLLKKKQLTTKYTLFWIVAGVLMLVIVVFPQLLDVFYLIGVQKPSNALFAIIFFCTFMILMFLTATVSKLNDRVTRLTQSLALLEQRVRELEKQNAERSDDNKEEDTL